MSKILFSCVGTSDPIRGEHDGPLLHILRHYKPDKVMVFLTKEIFAKYQKIDCKAKMTRYLQEKFGGYAPELHTFVSDISDPSDMDALENDLIAAFKECLNLSPSSEVLINVSSGTGQMQIILSQFALDGRYNTKAIQVKNFEKRAGTSDRVNSTVYDLDLEIGFNEDDLPDAPNRCVEPKMYPVLRNGRNEQIRALLAQRDFVALRNLKDSIPNELYPLVCHLAERSLLHTGEAYGIFRKELSEDALGFKLFPEKQSQTTASSDLFHKVVEYAMLFRNLEKSRRYSEYLMRMEPINVALQAVLADRLLNENCKCGLNSFVNTDRDGKKVFSPKKMKDGFPDLYEKLKDAMNTDELKETPLNTRLLWNMIQCIGSVPDPCEKLFSLYEKLKSSRNNVAHELKEYTEEDIRNKIGKRVNEVTGIIEGAVAAVFDQCDPSRFNVYDKCVEYIKTNLY